MRASAETIRRKKSTGQKLEFGFALESNALTMRKLILLTIAVVTVFSLDFFMARPHKLTATHTDLSRSFTFEPVDVGGHTTAD